MRSNNWKHGHSGHSTNNTPKKPSPEYVSWCQMRARCLNPDRKDYPRYGGRGITICSRWLDNFENFYEDMGPRPSGRSLERIDNSKGYFKENCRWATPVEQAANTRQALRIEHNGDIHTLMEWSRITGIPKSTLWNRLMKFGYTVAEALTIPPSPNNAKRKSK